jgi:hypothetical protein
MNQIDKKQALSAALNGLDFLVRHQITDQQNANFGRFVCRYDFTTHQVLAYTDNWTTAVCIEAMLAGHKFTGKQIYFDAAQRAIDYIVSLQFFDPSNKRMHGVIREKTPQTRWAHPRDALTAAWAMLDWSQYAGQKEYFEHSILFAGWFIDVAMEKGYPYWTVRFDDAEWLPRWFGSFQSGGAFYFYRLFSITGEKKYQDVVFKILDHYNKYHLEQNGKINVIVDTQTLKPLCGYKTSSQYSNYGWETMHEYNDDFGALANMAAYKLSSKQEYLRAFECFLKRMLSVQRSDGGFGHEEYSDPAAGGSILMELMAAKQLGFIYASPEQINRIVQHILSLQVQDSESPAFGAFRGFNHLDVIGNCSNSRTAAYAIMALLRYAGAVDSYYFFDFPSKQRMSKIKSVAPGYSPVYNQQMI